jgi:hypothetical protein
MFCEPIKTWIGIEEMTMADDMAVATAFWSDLDNTFKYNPSDEVQQLYLSVFSGPGSPFDFSRLLKIWRAQRAAGTYPVGYVAQITPLKNSILRLAELQIQVFDRHFQGNRATEQTAFELFGQGVLFDDARPVGDKVHLMDTGGPSNPPIGYHRWHVFARSVQLLDVIPPAVNQQRWLGINREIGLAWAIQSEMKPIPDSRANPPIAASRLQSLRAVWTSQNADGLDVAFDAFPYPTTARPSSQVEQIKAILESLVGGQRIGAHRNFWRSFVTGDDFANFHVFGDPQLPLLVKGNAAASNLIKALAGNAPFDGSVFPRMHLPGVARRYATADEIGFVTNWINANCP